MRLTSSPLVVGGAATAGFLAVASYVTFDHVFTLADTIKASIANLVSQTELGLAAIVVFIVGYAVSQRDIPTISTDRAAFFQRLTYSSALLVFLTVADAFAAISYVVSPSDSLFGITMGMLYAEGFFLIVMVLYIGLG